MLSSSSDTPDLNSFSMADELAKVADSTKWARLPDMNDPGRIAELANAIGCSSVGDLLRATAAERGHIATLRMEAKGGHFARTLLKTSRASRSPALQVTKQ